MFGTLVYNELDKLAKCSGKKTPLMKTDVAMIKKALMENPQQVTPPGGYKPRPITPGLGVPAQPITPANGEQPKPITPINQPLFKGASLQESTMNMFGVLVNMELQKLAAEQAPTFKDIKKKAPKPSGSAVFGVKAPEEELELPTLPTFGRKQ
jgi:hypothetical protein